MYARSGQHLTRLSAKGMIASDEVITPITFQSNGLPVFQDTATWPVWSADSNRFGVSFVTGGTTCKFATYAADGQQKSAIVAMDNQCGGSPRIVAAQSGYVVFVGGVSGGMAGAIQMTGTGEKVGTRISLQRSGSPRLAYREPPPSSKACTVLEGADRSLSVSCVDSDGGVSPASISFDRGGDEVTVVWNGNALGVLTVPTNVAQDVTMREVSADGTWSPDIVTLSNSKTPLRQLSWNGREWLLFERPNDDFSDRKLITISRCQ
jgi:hypothetical protein